MISTRGAFYTPALKYGKNLKNGTPIKLWKHGDIKKLLEFLRPLWGELENLGFVKYVFEFPMVYQKKCAATTPP